MPDEPYRVYVRLVKGEPTLVLASRVSKSTKYLKKDRRSNKP